MIQVNNVSLKFGKRTLFEDVNIKFTNGNCYGLIGANGSGKSTFLKILSGEQETTTGEITVSKDERISILKQDHYEFDDKRVLDVVIMGNQKLYQIMEEKDRMYQQTEFSEEDGMKLANLEAEFMDLDGWNAEPDAATLLNNLGVDEEFHYMMMGEIPVKLRVKVLLAQALFGNPDILLLDEPTSHLDISHQIKILNLVQWLNHERNLTVLLIIHDLNLASEFSDQLVMLKAGRVHTTGTPEEVLTYKNIETVYDTLVVTQKNPLSGKPCIFPVSENLSFTVQNEL